MSVLATASYAYAGFARWPLWFDNPNKAAALFACVALAALAGVLHLRSRAGAWSALGLLALSGYALLHTFSRGGLLALAAGACALLAAARSRRALLVPPVVLALLLLAPGRGALRRLAEAAPARDASVANRLVLWRAVPRMMADAPSGWGLGRAGGAFMSWYQPLTRREGYRTLVSSHATWLVEGGRAARCVYVVGWLAVLGACALHAWRRRKALPLALWLCLATTAAFSSVAEAWELWVLPGAALVPVALFLRTCGARTLGILFGVSGALGCGAVAALEGLGRRQTARAPFRIAHTPGRTVLGNARPTAWLVADPVVIGGPACGRLLRARAQELPGNAWGVADTLAAVPADVRRLALCGAAAAAGPAALAPFPHLADVRVLAPEKPAVWLAAACGGKTPRVYCGEFSAACPAEDRPSLTVVPGARDYLPQWPLYAFGD